MGPRRMMRARMMRRALTERSFDAALHNFRPPRVPAGCALRSRREHVRAFAEEPDIWSTRPNPSGDEAYDMDPDEIEAARLEEQARQLIIAANKAHVRARN